MPCDEAPSSDLQNGACSEVDPARPLCIDGTCQDCTVDNGCLAACSVHDQCPGSACDLVERTCISPTSVVRVAVGESIADAIQSQPEVNPLAILLEGPGAFAEELRLTASERRIAIRGAGEGETRLESGSDPTLEISGRGALYVADLSIRPSAFNACVTVRDSALYMDDVQVSACVRHGLAAEGSELFFRNVAVGVREMDVPAVTIQDSRLVAEHVTFAAGIFDSPAFRCDARSEALVTNSIFANSSDVTPEIDCTNLSVTYSATENIGVLGAGNVPVGSMDSAWFVFHGLDMHLSEEGFEVFAGIAQPSAESPLDDIDGDPRPREESDWPGADRPAP